MADTYRYIGDTYGLQTGREDTKINPDVRQVDTHNHKILCIMVV